MCILAVVVAVAVPSYSGYAKRSKVAEGFVIANEARVALIADHIKRRKFVGNHGNVSQRNIEIGLASRDTYKSETVLSMWVGSRGVKGASAS